MNSDFIWRFTPSRTDPLLLEDVFVQRESILKDVVERVKESATTGNKHHMLLIGPRGIGKTHFVSLVYHRLSENKQLSKKLRIAWLSEDETSTSFVQLLARIYRALSCEYPEEFPAKKLDDLLQLTPNEVEHQLKDLFVSEFGSKTLLVIVENLDLLFEGLGSAGQKNWRSFLQEHPISSVVATSQRLFKGVQQRTEPFFGFFTPIHLKPLAVSDAVLLLRRIATHNGQVELVGYLQSPEGRSRVRALHHLAGGNHRIYIVLSGFITRDSLEELVQPFEKMADELTPYYQERMRWLSPQQRQIVEFLCTRTSPVTPKEIAKQLLAAENTISSQLKKLSELGYVFSQRRGRESLYELAEPLMRLASEVKQRGTLRLLVDFLRVWYRPERLPQMLELARSETLKAHISAAISAAEDALDPQLTAIQHEIDGARAEGRVAEAPNALEEKAHTTNLAEDWLECASGLAGEKRYEEAIQCFDKALELNAKSSRAWGDKGHCLNLLQQYEDAVHCFDKALQIDSDYAYAWRSRGFSEYNLQRHQEAFDCLDRALGINPEDESAWGLKGITLFSQNQHQEAIDCFDKALAIRPKFAEFWRLKGSSLDSLQRYEEAIECFDKALEIGPEDAATWYSKGSSLDSLQKQEEAIDCFNSSLQVDPRDSRVWFRKGNCLNQLQRYEEAIQCFDKALAVNPENTSASSNKGCSLFNLRQYEEAIKYFNRVLEIDAKDVLAWLNKGKSHNRLQQYEEAIQCFDKALVINPSDVETWKAKGTVFWDLKRYEEAVICFDKVSRIDPADDLAWSTKGFLLWELRRFEEANHCYDKALEIDPDDECAWNNKGFQLKEMRRHEAALECYVKALEVKPGFPYPAFNICEPLFGLGKWGDGFDALRDAFQGDAGEYIGTLESIVNTVHIESDGAESLGAHVRELVEIYSRTNLLTSLGNGLVRSLKKIDSDHVTATTLEIWRDTWSEVSAGRAALEVSVRIYKVGIEYLIKRDEKVLLDLIKSERLILQQAIGLESAQIDDLV